MSVKVIIVGSDPDGQRFLKAILDPLGCEVTACSNSQDAEELLQSEKLDGAFVDAELDGSDGIECVHSIRNSRLNARTPVVVIAQNDDAGTMRKSFDAGATFFLGKPLTRERVHHLFYAARGAMLMEQRRHVRLPFQASVRCRDREKDFELSSVNLGEGGMLLEPADGLELDQEFNLEFVIPQSSQPVKARAKVLRKESANRAAVEFVALKLVDREAIRRFVFDDGQSWSKPGSTSPLPQVSARGNLKSA